MRIRRNDIASIFYVLPVASYRRIRRIGVSSGHPSMPAAPNMRIFLNDSNSA